MSAAGAVAEPFTLPKLHPYVKHSSLIVRTPGTMELPNGTFWAPAASTDPTVRAPGTMELPNGTFWSSAVEPPCAAIRAGAIEVPSRSTRGTAGL